MAKILMGWELGGGLGHLAQLKSVGRALAAAGHELVYVVRHLDGVKELFAPDKVDARLAPEWTGRERFGDKNFVTATLADVMGFAGFKDVETIGALFSGWDALFAEIKPDLILGEAAPVMWLAARGRIPSVAIGNGVMMPPSDLPALPRLVEKVEIKFPQDRSVEAVNRVQRARGGPTIEALPEMFAGDATFVLNLPLLDPYAHVRARRSDGPIEAPPAPAPLPDAPNVFAYIGRDHPRLKNFYRGLHGSKLPALVYVRGIGGEEAARLSRGRVRIVHRPQPLGEIVKRARLVVHYGGTGTVTTALAIGRPQMVMAIALERQLNAKRIQELGVGVRVVGPAEPERIAKLLTHAAHDPAIIQRTQEAAAQIAADGYRDQVPVIAAACEKLLSG